MKTLGNLILANDKAAIISEKLEDQKDEIAEALDVPVEVGIYRRYNQSGLMWSS